MQYVFLLIICMNKGDPATATDRIDNDKINKIVPNISDIVI